MMKSGTALLWMILRKAENSLSMLSSEKLPQGCTMPSSRTFHSGSLVLVIYSPTPVVQEKRMWSNEEHRAALHQSFGQYPDDGGPDNDKYAHSSQPRQSCWQKLIARARLAVHKFILALTEGCWTHPLLRVPDVPRQPTAWLGLLSSSCLRKLHGAKDNLQCMHSMDRV